MASRSHASRRAGKASRRKKVLAARKTDFASAVPRTRGSAQSEFVAASDARNEGYDPNTQPDPKIWLELPEDTRIALIRMAHTKDVLGPADPELHAIAHLMVENLIAANRLNVERTLARLMGEDRLDRHTALHALAAVVTSRFTSAAQDAVKGKPMASEKDWETELAAALDCLTFDSWYRDFGPEEDE